jgi:hypothetical protein
MQNNLLTIQKEGRPAIVNPGFLYAALETTVRFRLPRRAVGPAGTA